MYRLLSAVAGPFSPILLAGRLKRGKEHRQRLPERRGESRIGRPEGPLIWLHGASVGELASVLPLIDRIRARGFGMLVTTGVIHIWPGVLIAAVLGTFIAFELPALKPLVQ